MSQASTALAPDTQRRLDELFAGRACARCGAPAVRLSADQFYCVGHFLRRVPREATPPRIYWCAAGPGR